MDTSPAELTLLISAGSAIIGVAARSLLLLVAGLAAIYAKTPSRRKAAAGLGQLLMTLPWQRGVGATTKDDGARSTISPSQRGRARGSDGSGEARAELEDADETRAL